MKKLVVKNLDACEACLSCENACSKAFYKVENVNLSCIHINGTADGKIDIATCTQCGKCMEACPTDAISQNAKGVYTINKDICIGCLNCLDVCPSGVICRDVPNNGYATKCIACGICAKACPQGVLAVEDI